MKVSIIVPAYNDEEYLSRSIGSCEAQTYDDIEVICVDDASADGTYAALCELAKQDERIKVVRQPQNSGTHLARKAGLDVATGDLVTFLDADDELRPEMCERAVREYKNEPYDVLHFASKVVGDGVVSRQRVAQLTSWMRPVDATLEDSDIAWSSFVDHNYSFNSACKVYPRSLVQRAFDQIEGIYSDAGEDALEYFAISYYAQRYRGLPKCKYYVYHLGDGQSEHEQLSADAFERTVRLYDSVQGIRQFLESVDAPARAFEVYEAHRDDQLHMTLRILLNDVSPEDRIECMKRVIQTWPEYEVIDTACDFGTEGLDLLTKAEVSYSLTTEQIWKWGRADGLAEARAEYDASISYRVGKIVTYPARLMLKRP